MNVFYQLLGNTVVAATTNFTVWFALTYFVYLETHSVFASSLVAGTFLIATAASGFWLGSFVDHYKKKTVMLGSSILSLTVFTIGLVVYIVAPDSAFQSITSPLLWLFIPLLLSGVIVGNVRMIALSTIVTILFEPDKRANANGLVGTASGISFLIVSVISGLLMGYAGMLWVLIIAVVLSIATIAHMMFIQIPEHGIAHVEGHEETGKKVDIRGTLRVIGNIRGLFPLLIFTTFNNFLGGVFMALMDPYGLSLMSVQRWGIMWGVLSCGFLVGGALIAKWGLGKNPLRTLFLVNIFIWAICAVFTIHPSVVVLFIGMFAYLIVIPYIEASEQTILQKVVPKERQGRVFGFAQSMEQSASPLTAFLIGPLTQFFFIPFMTTGRGVDLIGGWFGTGEARGMALVFTVTGIIGLITTILAMSTKYYRQLSDTYLKG